MFCYALAFLAGVSLVHVYHALPMLICAFLIMVGAIRWRVLRALTRKYTLVFIFAILGYVYATWYQSYIQHQQLAIAYDRTSRWVEGVVASIPTYEHGVVRFNFKSNIDGLLHLVWRKSRKRPHVGEYWKFNVKLTRIRGEANPGGFDYKSWSLIQGLSANGRIREGKLLSDDWYYYPISRLRNNIHDKLQQVLPKTEVAPWLLALITGERHHIVSRDWEVLRATGTNHLMAIAGLHIGFVCGFVGLVASWGWRRFPAGMMLLPAQDFAAMVALVVGSLYALLAGFLIPAQRACLMFAVLLCSKLARRYLRAWTIWSLALFVVLLLNPLTSLSESFWLSFGTLAIIIYCMDGRIHPTGWWWQYFRVQWVVGLGLIPLSILFFQQISLISFVVNTLAIPWLGFSVLPFCVLAGAIVAISPEISSILLSIAGKTLSALWFLLANAATFPMATLSYSFLDKWQFIASLVACMFALIPAGVPGRWVGIIWLLFVFNYPVTRPNKGDYWISILDVGQGLSVVVQTKNHIMIYDAGPRLSERMDAGKYIVKPYLQHIGIRKIDQLIISHGDNDHIGGAFALYQSFPIQRVLSSAPSKLSHMEASYCLAGYHWRWDGVSFSILYPDQRSLNFNNDSSCVIKVDNGRQSLLLTGDIEKVAEMALLDTHLHQLAADVLIAPHHGSKTSALPKFLEAVSPGYVIYSTGFHNRYHFPHPSVVKQYQNMHVRQMNTAESGMIKMKMLRNSNVIPVTTFR